MAKFFIQFLFSSLLVLLTVFPVKAQTSSMLRSTLSACGLSKEISTNGCNYLIQQSIGQSSIIGPLKTSSNTILQGFIQPLFLNGKSKGRANTTTLNALIYPNPVIDNKTTLYLKEEVSNDIVVNLYDVYGRSLKSDSYDATIQKLTVDLSSFVAGIYILKIQAGEKRLMIKLINN